MKILYVTTIGPTMSFFVNFINKLIEEGHTVDIATNDTERKVPDCYKEYGCHIYTLSCSRSPFHIGNWHSIKQIREIVENGKYDIVHCHTPIAAACTRFACKRARYKIGVKVFYTAHGFHFYNGAPIKNWLMYYPIEKFCSRFTDKLITINTEDYKLAKEKFKAKEVHYVPGVGIDLSKFENVQVDKATKRREIGVPEDSFLLLSVGELNENKNHQIIIKALAKLNNPNIHYAIAGVGEKKEYLENLAKELGIQNQLHLLGYRQDIPQLNHTSDAFCFPSLREGLSVSLMEAMACGLPVICSDIRGNSDLINDSNGIRVNPHNIASWVNGILSIGSMDTNNIIQQHKIIIQRYSSAEVIKLMWNIYES